MKRKSKVNKSESLAGKSLTEIVNIKPVNLATKKDLRLVNDLLRFGIKTVEEVVNEAIMSENPTLMALVSQFVNGINKKQKERLTEAIKSSTDNVLELRRSNRKKTKTNEVIEEAKLTGKSIKWIAEKRKVEAAIEKYTNMSLEELVRINPVNMHASKKDVRAVNYLIHKGLKNVDDVVEEAIASKNAKLMYYIMSFVDGITEYHKLMLINAVNKTDDTVMIYNIAHKYPNAVNTLSKGIVNSGKVSDMVIFARGTNNAPLVYLGDNIIRLANYETASSIFHFVRNHFEELSPDFIKKATERANELQNPWVIYNMARFKGTSIEIFAQELVKAVGKVSENAPWLLQFIIDYHHESNFPINEMVKALIETNNHRCVYRLIKEGCIEDDVLLKKLVNKLVSKSRTNPNHYCNNLLVSLVLDDEYYSICALNGIIRLGDAILIRYIIKKTENALFIRILEDFLARLKNSLESDECLSKPVRRARIQELAIVES